MTQKLPLAAALLSLLAGSVAAQSFTPAVPLVTSVFGRAGVVAAQAGDYSAAQVGALALGSNLSDVPNKTTALTNLGFTNPLLDYTNAPYMNLNGGFYVPNTAGVTIQGTVNMSGETVISGALEFGGGTAITTTPYAVTATDGVLEVTTTTLNITINLPQYPNHGRQIFIKDISNNANVHTITVNAYSGATIDGAASKTITTGRGSLHLIFNGNTSDWMIIS